MPIVRRRRRMKMTDTKSKQQYPYAHWGSIVKTFTLIAERKAPTTFSAKVLQTHLGQKTASPAADLARALRTLALVDEEYKLPEDVERDIRAGGEQFTKRFEKIMKVTYQRLFETVPGALDPQNRDTVEKFFHQNVLGVKADMAVRIKNCFFALMCVYLTKGDKNRLKRLPEKSPRPPNGIENALAVAAGIAHAEPGAKQAKAVKQKPTPASTAQPDKPDTAIQSRDLPTTGLSIGFQVLVDPEMSDEDLVTLFSRIQTAWRKASESD